MMCINAFRGERCAMKRRMIPGIKLGAASLRRYASIVTRRSMLSMLYGKGLRPTGDSQRPHGK